LCRIPFHILVFALALALDDGILKCSADLGATLRKASEKADHFNSDHPIDFSSPEEFRKSRALWHRDFDELLRFTARDYKALVADDLYDGPCESVYPHVFFFLDVAALLSLVVVAGFFVYQDTTTSFGASTNAVFVAVNALMGIFTFLGVLNFPILSLMKISVNLSLQLEECTQELKEIQRSVVGLALDLDEYNLHADIWDGSAFGVREPVFGNRIDTAFDVWITWWVGLLLIMTLVLGAYLMYRANVKSLMWWRSAIPSVVCIGVVFPESSEPQKLWRVGSGCIVSSSRGLILTNWHLFQKFGSDPDTASEGLSPLPGYARTSSEESVSKAEQMQINNLKRLLSLDVDTKTDEFGVPLYSHETSSLQGTPPAAESSTSVHVLQTPPMSDNHMGDSSRHFNFESPTPVAAAVGAKGLRQRHLTNGKRFADSFAQIFPSMEIYVGTATRGHPNWQYTAKFTGVESPSAEFSRFGLDLLVLELKEKVEFDGLLAEDELGVEKHAYTYSFDAVHKKPLLNLEEENLAKFKIGHPFSLKAGDEKLRLLGFPASGGFTLSVLTGYFTSMSFDYPAKHRGAWLNMSIALPHGGSGGAAINGMGELVGVCTQTKGELTNIRAITEAIPLIDRAKKVVDERHAKQLAILARDPLRDASQSPLCIAGAAGIASARKLTQQAVRRMHSTPG